MSQGGTLSPPLFIGLTLREHLVLFPAGFWQDVLIMLFCNDLLQKNNISIINITKKFWA